MPKEISMRSQQEIYSMLLKMMKERKELRDKGKSDLAVTCAIDAFEWVLGMTGGDAV